MSRKPGKYSTQEEKFVIDNVHSLSAKEIADKLGRNVESVENLIKKKKLKVVSTKEEEDEVNRLIGVLHSSPHWEKINIALTEKEIKLFEKDWVYVVQQFGEDVWYTEELYIVDWLLLNIKKYRTYKLEKEALQEIEKLEKLIETEYSLDAELRDIPSLIKYEQELSVQKAAITQYTVALKTILEKIEKISDKLKANREERRDIKANEDTYWGYIKMLEDEKFRRKEARRIELMKLAQKKAREKLYEYHEYMDGEVDIPLLTPEIVLRKKEEEKYERTSTKTDNIRQEET